MLPASLPPPIWTISLEFYRKPSILAAGDFLGACYRKATTPQKLWTLLFSITAVFASRHWDASPGSLDSCASKVETFRGATGTPQAQAGPTPLARTPAEPLCLDLIRTRFRPDFDLILTWNPPFSGPNQVEIGSKSGPGRGVQRGSVPEG